MPALVCSRRASSCSSPAWLAERRVTQVALVAYAAFAIPHAAYHALNPAPGLTGAEDVQNAATLVLTAVGAIVLFVAASRTAAPGARVDVSA